ncbi:TetR/AcrR family transcriptional regulator [Nocardia sp. SSK8]|uniref:TetR/AcrR family transcriptional regulator n=1 Tax=Nocardia sp. SSK8 TaxID=3120154 RepID=UPI003009247C
MTTRRRYRGESAERRRARRHAALLDAALEIVGTSGVEKATIGGLCALAGLNSRYFYEHFTGRADVLAALVDRLVREVFTAGDAAFAENGGDPRAAVAAAVGVLLDDPRKARAIAIARAAPGDTGGRATIGNLLGGLGVSFRAANCGAGVTGVRLAFCVDGAIGALTSWSHGTLPLSREQLIDQVAEMIERAGCLSLKPPPCR